jgi:cytochrome c oxidase assembly protein Cox11
MTAAVVAAGGTTRRDKTVARGDVTQKVPLNFQTNEKVHLPYCFKTN